MNRHYTTLLGLALACGVTLPASAAEVHKWVDADGVTHYSDKPPDSVETTLIELAETVAVKTANEGGRPDDYYSISNQWQRMNQERLERERLNLERERIRAARQPAATVAERDNYVRYVPVYSGFGFHRPYRKRHRYVAIPHQPQQPQPSSPPPAPPLTGVISPP